MAKKSIETQIKEKMAELEKAGKATGRKAVYPNISYDFARDKFYVTFDYGYHKGERKKKQKTFSTAKAAAAALSEFLAQKEQEIIVVPVSTTVEDYCRHWQAIQLIDASESTKVFYAGIINNHILPYMGTKPIQSITTAQINSFLSYQSTRTDVKLSDTTIKKHRDALRKIFSDAEYEDIIKANPVNKSKKIKVRKKQPDAFTLEEIRSIIELSKTHEKYMHGAAYRLAIYTGLRRGELCGLKWKNVNLEDGYIFIEETRTMTTNGFSTDHVKTDTSIRSVELMPDAVELLAEMKQHYEYNKRTLGKNFHDLGFVYCYDDGTVCVPQTLHDAFKKFLSRNNIRSLPFHALRHSFGTFHRMVETSAYDIKELMGHSSIAVAEKSYIKPFAKGKQKQMVKYQELLDGDSDEDEVK